MENLWKLTAPVDLCKGKSNLKCFFLSFILSFFLSFFLSKVKDIDQFSTSLFMAKEAPYNEETQIVKIGIYRRLSRCMQLRGLVLVI